MKELGLALSVQKLEESIAAQEKQFASFLGKHETDQGWWFFAPGYIYLYRAVEEDLPGDLRHYLPKLWIQTSSIFFDSAFVHWLKVSCELASLDNRVPMLRTVDGAWEVCFSFCGRPVFYSQSEQDVFLPSIPDIYWNGNRVAAAIDWLSYDHWGFSEITIDYGSREPYPVMLRLSCAESTAILAPAVVTSEGPSS